MLTIIDMMGWFWSFIWVSSLFATGYFVTLGLMVYMSSMWALVCSLLIGLALTQSYQVIIEKISMKDQVVWAV